MQISRKARDTYRFDKKYFASSGDLFFNDLHGVRSFVQTINSNRDVLTFPELAIRTSEVHGIAVIQDVFNHIIDSYKQQENSQVFFKFISQIKNDLQEKELDIVFQQFTDDFPPPEVHSGNISPKDYLNDSKEGETNTSTTLERMLRFWLTNTNPAYSRYREFFESKALEKTTIYRRIIEEMKSFFDTEPLFGPDNQNLITMLSSIAEISPNSISEQLECILDKWGPIIGDKYHDVLLALDLFKEEEKFRGAGPGESLVIDYDGLGAENYTSDRDWMPNVVMIAKNAYVWLDQLSKKYQKDINKLDQIPDEELDLLSRWGFSALWLIGLWERSKASKTIKQWCGNPEAEASAYSLYDYIIASDLGGYEAYKNLQERAWRRGIRLSSDMVPNHSGIDSKWMMEHPDWFVSLPHSPFPSYSFSGESLSDNPRVGIYLEDHYFTRTDAAVAFKRVDHETNDIRYVYHGNDGTSMPWNDTAQLNYLNPEVREAVIQTILRVARMFPIIRFDAAMTLTRKHYQRLWYPEPGSGGDIPSRAEHGLTKEEFVRAMPEEFWREVVERINNEVPDTLLLAEAFWLLEGFFVRTLGMHRVYNSAFMNMLRDEDNAKYRSVIKNTLEFDPEILQRFVNFMNNPDEETAVKQFGKEDKYFGICILLVTMPGLPMFGHGQIEGFAEKYGMEYRRAYWDEKVDIGFVHHHEKIVFPLIKKRYIFAGASNFQLYDFYTAGSSGTVNEDVFAYSNRSGSEKAVVIYHNKYTTTSGWIKTSAAKTIKNMSDIREFQQSEIGKDLLIDNNNNKFTVYRDMISGLEFIRNNSEIHNNGLYLELKGYQSVIFTDFREIHDNEWNHYSQLHSYLNGRGVPDVNNAAKEIIYEPLIRVLRVLINHDTTTMIFTGDKESVIQLSGKTRQLLQEVANYTSGNIENIDNIEKEIIDKLQKISRLSEYSSFEKFINSSESDETKDYFTYCILESLKDQMIAISWVFLHLLGKLYTSTGYEIYSCSWIDEWFLGNSVKQAITEANIGIEDLNEIVPLVKILTVYQNLEVNNSYRTAKFLFSDPEIQLFLRINRYNGVLWFNREAFKKLIKWFIILETIKPESNVHLFTKLLKSAMDSGYRVDRFLEFLKE